MSAGDGLGRDEGPLRDRADGVSVTRGVSESEDGVEAMGTGEDTVPIVLIAAGTDPSGGAGVLADVRVCDELGCWGMPVVTAVVAQSTLGVRGFDGVSPSMVLAQWDAVVDDCPVAVVKLGMLGTAAVAEALVSRLCAVRETGVPVVFDPVLASEAGRPLARQALVAVIRDELVGHVDVLTPNVPEAEVLLGRSISSVEELQEAALALVELGARSVLLKGGHLAGSPGDALAWRGGGVLFLANDVVVDADVHGTGCHLASAIAAHLAHGLALEDAIRGARSYLLEKFLTARWRPGRGREILRRLRSEVAGALRRGAGIDGEGVADPERSSSRVSGPREG